MQYTAVIRTLGTAGDKYRQLLESLQRQTIRPSKTVVYIAEGYDLPREATGCEEYVYVKKGMVAQRALQYNEVTTEYMLFLDDDIYLPENMVEKMHKYLVDNHADVISPDVYPDNAERPFLGKLTMAVSGRMVARRDNGKWGYKVMRNSGYSYNSSPRKEIYLSQTNAGACFFCRKDDFMKIRFDEELWLDKVKYALGDDQVMFYKMYCMGLKQLTWFHSGIKHLDAGSALGGNADKTKNLIYADFRFKIIFWHRFIYLVEHSWIKRQWAKMCIVYTVMFTLLISLLKGKREIFGIKKSAITEAIRFIRSDEYRKLPRIAKYV